MTDGGEVFPRSVSVPTKWRTLADSLPQTYSGGDLRDQLAHVGVEAVRTGLVIGSGGNLSARSPGSDQCWITAARSWLDRLHCTDFSLIGIPDGELRAGYPNPSSEWRLHTETYLRRPDINAIIHLHPQASVLLTALGHDIALMTTHHAYYLREVVAVPFDQPGSAELAIAAAEAAAGGINVMVLDHHGCSVLADSVELAQTSDQPGGGRPDDIRRAPAERREAQPGTAGPGTLPGRDRPP